MTHCDWACGAYVTKYTYLRHPYSPFFFLTHHSWSHTPQYTNTWNLRHYPSRSTSVNDPYYTITSFRSSLHPSPPTSSPQSFYTQLHPSSPQYPWTHAPSKILPLLHRINCPIRFATNQSPSSALPGIHSGQACSKLPLTFRGHFPLLRLPSVIFTPYSPSEHHRI